MTNTNKQCIGYTTVTLRCGKPVTHQNQHGPLCGQHAAASAALGVPVEVRAMPDDEPSNLTDERHHRYGRTES